MNRGENLGKQPGSTDFSIDLRETASEPVGIELLESHFASDPALLALNVGMAAALAVRHAPNAFITGGDVNLLGSTSQVMYHDVLRRIAKPAGTSFPSAYSHLLGWVTPIGTSEEEFQQDLVSHLERRESYFDSFDESSSHHRADLRGALLLTDYVIRVAAEQFFEHECDYLIKNHLPMPDSRVLRELYKKFCDIEHWSHATHRRDTYPQVFPGLGRRRRTAVNATTRLWLIAEHRRLQDAKLSAQLGSTALSPPHTNGHG